MPSRVLLAAFVAVVAVVAAGPSVASAGTPCWSKVLSDWTLDGKIDGHYSPRCLRTALKHVPEDLGDYSSIKDDINAALLDTIERKSRNGGSGRGGQSGNGTYNNMGLGGSNGSGGAGPGGSGGSGGGPGNGNGGKGGSAAVPHAGTQQSVPSSSRSIPLPLLILGAIGLAAALAAASAPVTRRLRTRFPRTRPAPQTHRG